MIRSILCVCLMLHLSILSSLSAQCSRAADSIVLRVFYDATQGDFWSSNTGWSNPSAPISTYRGIKLSASGCVQEIKLTGNNLQGFLPPNIGTLSGLTIFDITNNTVGGNLPKEITNLTGLTKFSLAQNNFNGTIPSAIGNLTNLEELLFSQNSFTGSIPSSISACTKLITLSLSQNNIFGSIPTSLGQLSRLSTLYLDNNKFAGQIPASIYNLSNIREFWAFNNGLIGTLNPLIGNWTKMQKLLLNNNKLTGSIPAEIGLLTSMQSFHISDNQLSGIIPAEITNCNMLISLQMARNQLSGKIPDDIHKMTSLSTFDITDNTISGEIPEKIGSIPNLRRVYMSGNDLEGCFPQSLRKLCTFTESSNVNANGYNFRGNDNLIHAGDFARWCTGDGWADAKITPLPLICEGSKVEINATGGVTYNWYGPAGFVSQVQNPIIDPFINTNFGRYFVVIKNQQKCIDTSFIDIKPAGNTSTTANSPLCEGETIKLTSTGGLSYKWTGPNGFTSTESNPTIPNTGPQNAGKYTVVINIGNCDVTNTVDISFVQLGTINTPTPSICIGDTIVINAVLGNNQTITWSGPDNFSSTNLTASIPTNSLAKSGTYKAIIKSGTCQSTQTLEIKVKPKTVLTMPIFDPICSTDGLISLANPSDTIAGQWTGQNIKYNGTNFVFDPNALQGVISLTFKPDPSLCVADGIASIFISNVDVTTAENQPSNNDDDNNGSISIASQGDQNDVKITINGPVSRNVTMNGNQTVINDLPSGDYTVIATSIAGCLDTAFATVRYSKPYYFMPNIINSQSAVEKSFYVKGRNVVSYDLQVYDRWGGLIFDKKSMAINDAESGWIPDDTKHLTGVYIYVVTINGIEGSEQAIGSVTIL
jgi:Leucine-rich repeat (LRR) protein